MPKILVADKLSEAGLSVFQRHEQLEVHTRQGMSPDELRAEISKYDALIVRSSTRVSAEVLDAAENLKVIGRAGIGVDNIDIEAATLRGVVVMNTPQEMAAARRSAPFFTSTFLPKGLKITLYLCIEIASLRSQ